MRKTILSAALVCSAAVTLVMSGCATGADNDQIEFSSPQRYDYLSWAKHAADPELEERILRLNAARVTEEDVRGVLSRLPAPRVINLDGSLPLITMASFSRFLIRMGYPEASVRNPQNGDLTYSSYRRSRDLAGMVAWFYEREGMRPVLIGHSQGGMLVVKVLHELAGAFHEEIPVWNPFSGEPEDRYSISDPLTGGELQVRGLTLGYSAAVATGRIMRVVLGQWNMVTRLREIPDTVDTFTGFSIPFDLIGSDFFGFGGVNRYHSPGSAQVRNVKLPARCSHFTVTVTEPLAVHEETRRWINTYAPGAGVQPLFPVRSDNILLAAEIWYNIKKHWVTELKRLIQAGRNTGETGEGVGSS